MEEMNTEQQRGVKRKISLTRCDVCDCDEAKYRCPSCLRSSCSLPCVKKHKLESSCTGVRDRTAFVRLSQFSDINLLSDYRYLEETARVADRPNRDTLLRTHPHHSSSVKLLRRNATAAKVDLKILPKSFSRRKENTSMFIRAEKKLHWHLKIYFPQSSAEYTARVAEDRDLEQILNDYIHPTESDPVKRQRLKLYVLSSPDQLCVFMKSEKRQPGSERFHKLEVKKSLRENLMFKTVVEYPEVYVVLKEHCQEYLTRFPEKKSAVPSTSSTPGGTPPPPSSRQDPEAPESRKHTKKGRTGDKSETEEGEIRSEEDDDDDEDDDDKQHVHIVAHITEKKGTDTDLRLSREDGSSGDDEDDDGGQVSITNGQTVTMETNVPHPHCEGVEIVAEDQKVTMETVDPPPPAHAPVDRTSAGHSHGDADSAS
ncbi:box C/D snoRNA protein 1 [Hoplias malabaricus]|uniref:box C/D snoRNA protein 1 n=1 Tax=Hoplias malabaricus TaxID=27720 RepID=UPI0034627AE4